MEKCSKLAIASILFMTCILCAPGVSGDDGYDLWLKYSPIQDQDLLEHYRSCISSVMVQENSETAELIRNELNRAFSGLLNISLPAGKKGGKNATLLIGLPKKGSEIQKFTDPAILQNLGNEGFFIQSGRIGGRRLTFITANQEIGLLYGTFHLIKLMQTGESIDSLHITSIPKIQHRLLNHWANLDGSIERGYAGKMIWKWDELPDKIDPRYADYARANASIGINGTVLNNVNANPEILCTSYLKKVAGLADIFRPYGIRVYLSINFSSPISSEFSINGNRRGGIGNLPTSDPSNPEVRQWWKDKAAEIYQYIPDFGGFLVKANSEGMPGPMDYGLTHADGANMLAEALAPYGGIVMWRAFVYVPTVDPDRAKRAYLEFVPLDGQFHDNVFVQGKNGPVDFQPREPVQPLFGAMPHTPLMLELQITQEYLGHSTHLVYLAPMWREYLDFETYAGPPGTSTLAQIIDGSFQHYSMTGIAGVSNIGDDRNWCGHFFAQANWYAFGRLAWDHQAEPEEIAEDWIRMSLTRDKSIIKTVRSMMLGSWEACVNYETPLGLHHIMQAGYHYGPGPDFAGAPREDWNSVYYHKADENGIGFDRSSTGSNFTAQYHEPLHSQFDNIKTCPEKYLLWFHHVPWDYTMKSGRTLWYEMCLKYHTGVEYVKEMRVDWASLEGQIDPEIFEHVKNRLKKHEEDAGIYANTCVQYFQKFSKMDIPDL